MKKERGFLLASFITSDDTEQINEEVEFIVNHLNLTSNYIFLMKNLDEPSKKILTYNAQARYGEQFNPRLYTMRIHRKKHTNTFYTINALNAAVAEQNNGQTGKHLRVDWEPYRDSVLLTSGKKLQTYPIEVVKIFKIEDPPEDN